MIPALCYQYSWTIHIHRGGVACDDRFTAGTQMQDMSGGMSALPCRSGVFSYHKHERQCRNSGHANIHKYYPVGD